MARESDRPFASSILPILPPRRKRKTLVPSHGGVLPVPLSQLRASACHRRVVLMVEQISVVIERVLDPATRPKPERQPSLEFWKDFNEDLKAAKTPAEKDAVWARYAEAKNDFRPNRRQRRGSTLDPVK